MKNDTKLLSVIIPLHNEEKNVLLMHAELTRVFNDLQYDHELLFINDGSTDASINVIKDLALKDPRVFFVDFSRNFGKEVAMSAGLHASDGDAAIIIDADMQHPPYVIPELISKWEQGGEVVIGVRRSSKSDSLFKRVGSNVFYATLNLITKTEVVPHATDFRLLDRMVIDEFNRCSERNRITRGLIDWLGFKREYVEFEASKRVNGVASYNVVSLIKLAVTGFVSQSLFPLRLAGYIGVVITAMSGILGIVMVIDRYFIADWHLNFSGPAILANIILFLIGIVLMCFGLVAFYIAHIYEDTRGRPLYVLRH